MLFKAWPPPSLCSPPYVLPRQNGSCMGQRFSSHLCGGRRERHHRGKSIGRCGGMHEYVVCVCVMMMMRVCARTPNVVYQGHELCGTNETTGYHTRHAVVYDGGGWVRELTVSATEIDRLSVDADRMPSACKESASLARCGHAHTRTCTCVTTAGGRHGTKKRQGRDFLPEHGRGGCSRALLCTGHIKAL